MNTLSDVKNTAVSAGAESSGGFYERLFVRALRSMTAGAMEMRLPGGVVYRYGQARAGSSGAVICVTDSAFFKKCVLQGDIGFAESYMEGDWYTPDLAAVFGWFLLNAGTAPTLSGSMARTSALGLMRFADRVGHLLRPNNRAGAKRNIAEHYDLSNDFFALWLDRSMLYSSAIFSRSDMTLAEAQTEKIDRICRSLRLQRGDKILEIGCGWGAFALHAAREYGVHVTGLTLSVRQAQLARERAEAAGLGDRITILIEDFRDHRGAYDRIVSIEMMEALGHSNQPVFAEACARLLKPDGLMMLQYITAAEQRYRDLRKGVDFIQKHVFPGSLLLSHNRVASLLAEKGGFGLVDFRDLTPHYVTTLRHWYEGFMASRDAVAELGFDEVFERKWRYYLQYCEAAFAARHIGVLQALYSRPNNPLLAGAAV